MQQLCLHVEVSDELPAEAVSRERASFVSRCTDRLARAADVLRAGDGGGDGRAAGEGADGGGADAAGNTQAQVGDMSDAGNKISPLALFRLNPKCPAAPTITY